MAQSSRRSVTFTSGSRSAHPEGIERDIVGIRPWPADCWGVPTCRPADPPRLTRPVGSLRDHPITMMALLSVIWGLVGLGVLAEVRGDDQRASDLARRCALLVDVESIRGTRRQVDNLYTPPLERGDTWVKPQLPRLPSSAEVVLWAWLLDPEDVSALTTALRDELRQFNADERTRRVADSRPLIMMIAQDLAVLIEQGRGTADDDAWRAFARECSRLASQFGAREDVFIRSLEEPLGLDVGRRQRLERVVLCRAIRRTYVDFVVMKPSDVDIVEVLVATDLAMPLVRADADRFDGELDRVLAELASLRRRWERQKLRSTAEHYSRVREAQRQGRRAPIDALRRDVVVVEEAIIAATLAATDALARQLDPRSGHRLRAAVLRRLFPEVHPMSPDLTLVLIDLEDDLAASGPWDETEAELHARARRILADGVARHADAIGRMEAMVMNLRRTEGMESIPLPALEEELLADLETHKRNVRNDAGTTLDELLRVDRRLAEFPAIQRLQNALLGAENENGSTSVSPPDEVDTDTPAR